MNRQQSLLILAGTLLLFGLFFFGRTKPPHIAAAGDHDSTHAHESVAIDDILSSAKARLTPGQQTRINALENSVVRGDVKGQKIGVYDQLAHFWEDSAGMMIPAAYYYAEKAKLENSENSLTFAAHFYLDQAKLVGEPALRVWIADQAKSLFENALRINPTNDSSKVGLGSCYIFGATGAASPMQGIQTILEVVRRDSTNTYAQFMLGYGAMQTGQWERAIERLQQVTTRQPHNLEAVFLLAEAYERSGDKANAIKWYSKGKAHVQSPELQREIDQRIESLR